MTVVTARRNLVWRSLEFGVLFFGIPLWVYLDKDFIHPSILVLPVLAFIFIVMRRTTSFQWKELIYWNIGWPTLLKHGAIVGTVFFLFLGYVLKFERENLFNLIRNNPMIFLAMSFFYPVFSAYGQELIYRTFLQHRYRILFPRDWHFILASGVTFSFLHIVYYDPVSMILTLIGGLYFARVYLDTRSVLFSSLLHSAMGLIVFLVGMGQYFWLDMPV